MCLNYLWHRTLPNWKLYQETWKRDVIKIAIIDTEFLYFTEIALIKKSAICGEVIGGELDPFPVQYSPLFQVIYHSVSQSEFRANTHKHSEN